MASSTSPRLARSDGRPGYSVGSVGRRLVLGESSRLRVVMIMGRGMGWRRAKTPELIRCGSYVQGDDRLSPSMVPQGLYGHATTPDHTRLDGFPRIPGERQVVGPEASIASSVSRFSLVSCLVNGQNLILICTSTSPQFHGRPDPRSIFGHAGTVVCPLRMDL